MKTENESWWIYSDVHLKKDSVTTKIVLFVQFLIMIVRISDIISLSILCLCPYLLKKYETLISIDVQWKEFSSKCRIQLQLNITLLPWCHLYIYIIYIHVVCIYIYVYMYVYYTYICMYRYIYNLADIAIIVNYLTEDVVDSPW
jgi:hypothetical protein